MLACQSIGSDDDAREVDSRVPGNDSGEGGRGGDPEDSKVEDLADLARDANAEGGSKPPPDPGERDAGEGDAGERDALVGGLPDLTGVHLLAVATFIDPAQPLLFKADVVLMPNSSPTPDNAGTLSVTAQALRCQFQQVCDKVPVGPVLPTISAPVNASGEFLLDLGRLTVPGEANPISGRPISAILRLSGAIRSDTLACGVVGGEIFDPVAASLDGTGSTFALTMQGAAGAEVDFLAAPVVKDCTGPAPGGL
jgi:hypothetical protein